MTAETLLSQQQAAIAEVLEAYPEKAKKQELNTSALTRLMVLKVHAIAQKATNKPFQASCLSVAVRMQEVKVLFGGRSKI